MGRKPVNNFTWSSFALQKGTEFKLFDVKVPFLYDFGIESTNPNVTKIGRTSQYYVGSKSELDLIRKELENDRFRYRILKIEKATRQLTDICPRCQGRGTPKIEKKDTRNYKNRTWRNKEEKLQKQRPSELWLTYTHSKSKKCWICQYVSPYPSYKKNNIEIERYFFPNVLDLIESSFVYSEQ